jgi:hypothetical protein
LFVALVGEESTGFLGLLDRSRVKLLPGGAMAEDEEDETAPASGEGVSEPAGAQHSPQSQYGPVDVPGASSMPGPPSVPAIDRVYRAWQDRSETDYIFNYWTALGWTILTIGIYGLYVFYQLVRRMRDHNARRVELLDSSLAFAWEEAGKRGLQEELTPSFQRADAHMDVLRRMRGDFREPIVWLVLAIVARGIAEIVAFVLLDKDLVKHDRAEVGVEYELSLIFGRMGQPVPAPDQARVKGENNYVGRIVATVLSLGVYLFWWYYNQMNDPNRHFEGNWLQEDALVAAIRGLRDPAQPPLSEEGG